MILVIQLKYRYFYSVTRIIECIYIQVLIYIFYNLAIFDECLLNRHCYIKTSKSFANLS